MEEYNHGAITLTGNLDDADFESFDGFNFDPKKSAANLKKHGFDFDFAARVFEGSYLSLPDDRHDYGEDRFVAIGPIDEAGIVIVVFVAWTLRPDNGKRICRIISARKATAAEREAYGAFQG